MARTNSKYWVYGSFVYAKLLRHADHRSSTTIRGLRFKSRPGAKLNLISHANRAFIPSLLLPPLPSPFFCSYPLYRITSFPEEEDTFFFLFRLEKCLWIVWKLCGNTKVTERIRAVTWKYQMWKLQIGRKHTLVSLYNIPKRLKLYCVVLVLLESFARINARGDFSVEYHYNVYMKQWN